MIGYFRGLISCEAKATVWGFHAIQRGVSSTRGPRYVVQCNTQSVSNVVVQSFSFTHAHDERKVQVIQVCGTPVRHVLSTFWASQLKNIATHSGLLCPYPQSTLMRRQMVVSKVERGSELLAYVKYLDRGFHRVSDEELKASQEFRSGRWLGDRLTRIVPYDVGVAESEVLTNNISGFMLDDDGDCSDLSDMSD